MNVFSVTEGQGPVILAQPHGGTHVPEEIFRRLNRRGQGLDDTDWHINRLYAGLLDEASVVQSHIHRYVIDANRDPNGQSLYPGRNTTSLCPLTDFDGDPIWIEGQQPSEHEIQQRRASYHQPYHNALLEQIERVRSRFGAAVIYDCHSIRSDIPFLFDGRLPVFCIGSDSGKTCHRDIESTTAKICQDADGFDMVNNGRFKGGWTTRHYGHPETGVHAIQMELAQRAYMSETCPWDYVPECANRVRPILNSILQEIETIARSGVLSK
jgi:N-formylglutamate deformylase